jgi:hypothetical protein
MDTVGVAGMSEPFSGRIEGGRVYGRGSCDMKAGIAAALFAAEAIERAGIPLPGTIEISGTVDEESGGFAGVAWLAHHGRWPVGEEWQEGTHVRQAFQYYSEIFNNLLVPSEEPVTGNLVDDLTDIYSDIAPGLDLFDAGRKDEAKNHWQFWLASHWGEHATSASRALWSYLAGREGSEPK